MTTEQYEALSVILDRIEKKLEDMITASEQRIAEHKAEQE